MKTYTVVTDDETKKEYLAVGNPDLDLVRSIVNECKGPARKMKPFEEECGVGAGVIYKVVVGRRTGRLTFNLMHRILEHACADCNVTLDGFAAANGLVSIDAISALLEAQKPAYKDVPDFRRREYLDAEVLAHPVAEVKDFERFIDNLSMFVDTYGADTALVKKADEMFKSPMLVLALEKWACHFRADEKAASAVCRNFIENHDDGSMQGFYDESLSHKYSLVILDTLKTMGFLQ